MEPFENMDSQTIERYYKDYLDSERNPQFELVILGHWTVNLKKMLLVKTDDPDNSDHHRIVLRANTHMGPRLNNYRFISPITAESLQLKSLTEE